MSSSSAQELSAGTLPRLRPLSAWCFGLSGAVVALALPWHPDILHGAMDETVRHFHPWTALHVVVAIGAVLSLVGVAGLVLAHAGRLGRWGWWGLLLTVSGAIATSTLFMIEAVTFPLLAEHAPQLLSLDGPLSRSVLLIVVAALSLGWPLGLSLVGAAAARAAVFPRYAGLMLVIAGLAFVGLNVPFVPVVGPLSAVAFGLVQIYWARLLWRGHPTAQQATS
jgi:hypothetical protein